jgi:hypothetical protein
MEALPSNKLFFFAMKRNAMSLRFLEKSVYLLPSAKLQIFQSWLSWEKTKQPKQILVTYGKYTTHKGLAT